MAGKAVAFNSTCRVDQSVRFYTDIMYNVRTPLWENCTFAIQASVQDENIWAIQVERTIINEYWNFFPLKDRTYVLTFVERNIQLLMEISLLRGGDIGLDPTVQAFCGLPTCKANIYSYLDANAPKCMAIWFLESYYGIQIVNPHELIARTCCAYDVAVARNKVWSSACKAELDVPVSDANKTIDAIISGYDPASDNGHFTYSLCQARVSQTFRIISTPYQLVIKRLPIQSQLSHMRYVAAPLG
jgi:hypothetical protein